MRGEKEKKKNTESIKRMKSKHKYSEKTQEGQVIKENRKRN